MNHLKKIQDLAKDPAVLADWLEEHFPDAAGVQLVAEVLRGRRLVRLRVWHRMEGCQGIEKEQDVDWQTLLVRLGGTRDRSLPEATERWGVDTKTEVFMNDSDDYDWENFHFQLGGREQDNAEGIYGPVKHLPSFDEGNAEDEDEEDSEEEMTWTRPNWTEVWFGTPLITGDYGAMSSSSQVFFELRIGEDAAPPLLVWLVALLFEWSAAWDYPLLTVEPTVPAEPRPRGRPKKATEGDRGKGELEEKSKKTAKRTRTKKGIVNDKLIDMASAGPSDTAPPPPQPTPVPGPGKPGKAEADQGDGEQTSAPAPPAKPKRTRKRK